MALKGALSHHVALGTDVFGNITRIDNVLGNLESEQKEVQLKLENIQVQLTEAKIELEKPFSKEEELKEKSKRLKEVNILLNMDEKDKSLLEDEPESEAAAQERNCKSYER